jgi:hypothetical protein
MIIGRVCFFISSKAWFLWIVFQYVKILSFFFKEGDPETGSG